MALVYFHPTASVRGGTVHSARFVTSLRVMIARKKNASSCRYQIGNMTSSSNRKYCSIGAVLTYVAGLSDPNRPDQPQLPLTWRRDPGETQE
jgi:hypothetical protein